MTGAGPDDDSDPGAHETTSRCARADYFGGLVNLAARVMASAHFGQVLITSGPSTLEDAEEDWNDVKNLTWDENHCASTTIFAGDPNAALPPSSRYRDGDVPIMTTGASEGELLHLRGVGYYELKGINFRGKPLPQLLISVTPSSLRAREEQIARRQPVSKGKTVFVAGPESAPEVPADYHAMKRTLMQRRSRRFKKISSRLQQSSAGLSRSDYGERGSFRSSLTRMGDMLSFNSILAGRFQYSRSLSPPGGRRSLSPPPPEAR